MTMSGGFLLLLVFTIACGRAAGGTTDPEVDALRADVLAAIQASTCPDEPCPVVSVTPQAAPAASASRGKRILLIDTAILVAAATRWPHALLGVLALGPDGTYAEAMPTFDMPRDALGVLSRIASFRRPVRASELDVAVPFFGAFGSRIPGQAFGHGMDILASLADWIPDAQFLVSEDLMNAPTPCDLLDAAPGDAAWAAHDAFVDRMSRSLESAVVRYELNYVHLSWGIDQTSLSFAFGNRCGRSPSVEVSRRYMQPYVDLFRRLTALSTPGADGAPRPVILFQAGVIGTDADAQLLDCTPIAGRVRVYDVAYAGTAVTTDGSHDYTLLPVNIDDLLCNDVFVVMGYTSVFDPPRRGAYFASMPFGMGLVPSPVWPPAPSFANPIALAHFALLTETYPGESTDAWIDRLTAGRSRSIIDPLLHDQLEISGGRPSAWDPSLQGWASAAPTDLASTGLRRARARRAPSAQSE